MIGAPKIGKPKVGKPTVGAPKVPRVSVDGGAAGPPATPTLTLISGATDNTPDFTLTGDLVVGDTIRFQYSTDSGFSGALEITNTIDSGEDAANELDFSTGSLADGFWYYRARNERPKHLATTWSTQSGLIDTTSPTITSANTANVAENTTAVLTVTATDSGSGLAAAPYSITGGADQAKFTINATSGALIFASAPDFENPTDVGTNNVYNVIVGAVDIAGNVGTQAIAVTVTDVAEGLSFVAGVETGGSGNGVTSGAINTTGANFLVAAVSSISTTPPTLSDNKGNTWTPLTAVVNGGAVNRLQIFYSIPTSVGAGHTVSLDGTANFSSVAFAAFSGAHTSPFDVQTGTSNSGSSPQAGSITPSQNNELVIAAAGTDGGTLNSINSSFNIVDSVVPLSAGVHFGLGLAYLIQGSAAAVNPTWTNSSSVNWTATIASFKKAP